MVDEVKRTAGKIDDSKTKKMSFEGTEFEEQPIVVEASSTAMQKEETKNSKPDWFSRPSKAAMRAIDEKSEAKLREALKKTNINNRSKFSDPLLLYAVKKATTDNNSDIVRIINILLQEGADSNLSVQSALPSGIRRKSDDYKVPVQPSGSISGETPLMYAASEGQTEIMTLLIKYGAEINAQTAEDTENGLDRMTPLMFAAQRGQRPAVQLLLAQPGIDVVKTTESGLRSYKTALTMAAKSGHVEIVEDLLSHYKNHYNNDKRKTIYTRAIGKALNVAIKSDQIKVAQAVIQYAKKNKFYIPSDFSINAIRWSAKPKILSLLLSESLNKKDVIDKQFKKKAMGRFGLVGSASKAMVEAYDLISKADSKGFAKFMENKRWFTTDPQGKHLLVDQYILKYTLEKMNAEPDNSDKYVNILEGLLENYFAQNKDFPALDTVQQHETKDGKGEGSKTEFDVLKDEFKTAKKGASKSAKIESIARKVCEHLAPVEVTSVAGASTATMALSTIDAIEEDKAEQKGRQKTTLKEVGLEASPASSSSSASASLAGIAVSAAALGSSGFKFAAEAAAKPTTKSADQIQLDKMLKQDLGEDLFKEVFGSGQ